MKNNNFLSMAAIAILLANPHAAATGEKLRLTQHGCLLDLSEQVAAEVRCGKRATVKFAVDWYGTDVNELATWFRLAGCTDVEAASEAAWAAERCQVKPTLPVQTESSLELRQLKTSNARRLVGKRSLKIQSRDDDDDDGDDDDDDDSSKSTSTSTTSTKTTSTKTTSTKSTSTESKTTSSTSTSDTTTDTTSSASATTTTTDTTSSTSATTDTTLATSTTSTSSDLASTSSYNPYVLTLGSGTSTSYLTCMTETTVTSTACSSTKEKGKWSTSCATAAVVEPTCLSGISCSFSQTTGALSCYKKDGIPTYGLFILGIMCLIVAFLFCAIVTMCYRDRTRVNLRRKAAEEKELLLSIQAKSVDVTVKEVEVQSPPPPMPHNDAAPLMGDTTETHYSQTPEIMVTGHTPTTESPAFFPPGQYDPFTPDHYQHNS